MQQMSAKQIEELVSKVISQLGDTGRSNGAVSVSASMGEQDKLGTGGMEPFDMEYPMMDYSRERDSSPFPRINKILREVHGLRQTVDDERAMLYTEAHKKFTGSVIVKNAKILKHIVENCSIHIYPDELIVGEIAAPRKHAPIFPEFSYDWICDELVNDPFDQRVNDNFAIPDNVKRNLLSIGDYWAGKNVMDIAMSKLTDNEIKGSSAGGRPVFFPNLYLYGGIGHLIPRYQRMFKYGYNGLKQLVLEQLDKVDITTPEGLKARDFHIAQLIALEAATILFKRYASLASEMASREADSKRKAELATISSNCEWVSENPPRTFWEAIQLYHLGTNLIHIEANGHSISYGRFDQIMWPFYEKDMKEGRITKREVCELIECFYIKMFELCKMRDKGTAVVNTEVGIAGTLLLVGGCDKNGYDATNDLSYLAIEAHSHTLLPDPWFAVRWGNTSPWEYKVKVVNSIKIGTGQPKIFNDEAIIPAAMASGRSLEHARDYSMVGCVEIDAGGLEYGAHDASYFSMSKVFELAINNGRCLDCGPGCHRFNVCGGVGKSLGLQGGSLENFKSIGDVKDAYEKQMKYWVDRMIAFCNNTELTHAELKPLPYLSSIMEGPTEKGKDVSAGGCIYNFTGPQVVGCATVADGMCTIQQLVFEEKRITGKELLDALKKNWVGYEALYQLVNSDRVHHFGNDDDYADAFAVWATDCFCNNVDGKPNARGGVFLPGVYSVSANVGIGLTQAASPDGRLAQEATSNCLGPVHTVVGCHDVKGPTAMAMSAAKINHMRAGNGTLTNVRFTPSCVSGPTGRDNFIKYIDTYFDRKAQHVQFNICNTETLKDAQKHPEKYPGMLVRVAGYSAYFVRLSKELQDDLIGRNAYDNFD
jgi:formate C-acetyltransferase